MPEFLGLDKKQWLWVGAGVAGMAGLYLMTHQGGSASAPAAADGTPLPQTGPPPMGNQTPSFFDPGEQMASFLSSHDRFLQRRQEQSASDIHPTGLVAKAWEQVEGGWLGIKADNQGMFLSEQQAQQLGSSNHGPYARGGGGFLGQIWKNVQGALQLYTASQGVPVATAQPQAPAFPRYTPPIAPTQSRAPRYGNSPSPVAEGKVPEVM